jgi:hypothetical protein
MKWQEGHVGRLTKSGYVDKQVRCRDYHSAYLRRAYQIRGKASMIHC